MDYPSDGTDDKIYNGAGIFYPVSRVLMSIIAFAYMNKFLGHYVPNGLSSDKVDSWKNAVISCIHAGLSFSLSFYYIWSRPWVLDNVIMNFTKFGYFTVCVSLGYFIYDSCDVMVSFSWKNNIALLTHHISIMVAYSIALFSNAYITFCCTSLLLEISGVFLHGRKIMRLNDVNFTSWAYCVNAGLNYITFLFARFPVFGVLLYWTWQYRNEIPLWLFFTSMIGTSLLFIINICLLQRMAASDRYVYKQSRKPTIKGLRKEVRILKTFAQNVVTSSAADEDDQTGLFPAKESMKKMPAQRNDISAGCSSSSTNVVDENLTLRERLTSSKDSNVVF